MYLNFELDLLNIIHGYGLGFRFEISNGFGYGLGFESILDLDL